MMKIVAEMMILANAAVGQRIHSAFPRAALLRRHPPPRREAFAEVRSFRGLLSCMRGAVCRTASLAEQLPYLSVSSQPCLPSLACYQQSGCLVNIPPLPNHPASQVAVLCESLGSPLELESGPAALAASLAAAAAAAPPAVASLIKSLATRAMSEAEYFCTGGL